MNLESDVPAQEGIHPAFDPRSIARIDAQLDLVLDRQVGIGARQGPLWRPQGHWPKASAYPLSLLGEVAQGFWMQLDFHFGTPLPAAPTAAA
jgi:hypothetical protein